MKKLSILLAILLTICTALSALPSEKVTAQSLSPSTQLYAGTSNPGIVYQYLGDNNWLPIGSTQELGNAYAVTSLVEYQGQLYASVTTGYGGYSGVGKVYVRDGDTSWTLVGDNMDYAVISLAVYKGDLYAGTGRGLFRLYKYTPGETNCSIENWTRVVNTGWNGVRSLYVSYISNQCPDQYVLLMGDSYLDRIGCWDGQNFTETLNDSGSCIYDFQDYGDYVYASAYDGRLWRSSDRTNWNLVLDYYDGNIWGVELFQNKLYMSYDDGELRVWDGSGNARGIQAYQAPDGIISMTTDGSNLYFGTGGDAVGYGCESTGTANIYRYDGTEATLISSQDQFGAGVQVLYSPEKPVVGYMWQDLSVLEGKRLTHVIESFALLDSRVEGYLDTDYYKLNRDTFVEAAENKNMVPLVSIQQASGDNKWSSVISDATKRAVFISSIVNLITEAGYKGVDIDLEALPNSNKFKEAYGNFIQELRLALDSNDSTKSPRRLITVAVQGGSLSRYSIPSLIKAADYVMLMGYNYYYSVQPLGPWETDPSAPRKTRVYLCVRDHLNNIVQMGYPADRVIYLLPFFAQWGPKGPDAVAWETLSPTERAGIVSQIMNTCYLEKQAVLNITGQKKAQTMWWTDPECIKAKVQAALFENNISLLDGSNGNIGGVGAWQIQQDGSNSELTQALWDAAHGL
jgi:hypothetical protein